MKPRNFRGGYRFKAFEGQPEDKLFTLNVPSKVIIPLSQGFGDPLDPLVKIGDGVQAGQIIARDDSSISSPIHSSINGKVVGIEKINYFNRKISMVVIEGDGRKDFKRIKGHSPQWEKLNASEIEELLYLSGVTSLDRDGIPTHFKSSVIVPEDVKELIIHGVGSEVFNPSLDLLLGDENLLNFVEAIKILRKIMPRAKFHLALNSEKPDIMERMKKLTSGLEKISIYPVVPKYPQGYDELLVPTLIGRKFPYGFSAANIGIVIISVQTALKVREAVVEGNPLIERIIALCGPSFKENIHIKVRVGTPIDTILSGRQKEDTARVVLNSLLTGFQIEDLSLPVDRTLSKIIAVPENKERIPFAFLRSGISSDSNSRAFLSAFLKIKKKADTNCYGEGRPCIQCGYCQEVCPVRIIPTLLDRYVKLGINEMLTKYGIFNCIDCNLCTYVCPSKIPLAENLKSGKARVIETGPARPFRSRPDLIGLQEYKGVKGIT